MDLADFAAIPRAAGQVDTGSTYTWNAENRLMMSVARTYPALADPNEPPPVKVEFRYDYLGRRIEKRVLPWNPALNGGAGDWDAGNLTNVTRFVWSGWLMLLELDGLAECGTPGEPAECVVRKYTWGLDLAGQNGQTGSIGVSPVNSGSIGVSPVDSGSIGVSPVNLEGAGTIGGLLAMQDMDDPNDPSDPNDATGRFACFYDGNGNLTQLLHLGTWDPNNPEVAIRAHYEYDPYGNRTNSPTEGEFDQPFRFSTKYFDAETCLYDFGVRFYSPRTGRWTSRDRIAERGGAHLYAFVLNSPVALIDPTGKEPCRDPSAGGRHPVHPSIDFLIDLRNFFARHDIDVWSEGGHCAKTDEEMRGICLCHQRCKWRCTDVSLCVSLEWKNVGCCATVFPEATLCNSGWIPCVIGDHFLFSCEPGIHKPTGPDDLRDVKVRCWGIDVGKLLDWFQSRFGIRLDDYIDIKETTPPKKESAR